MDDPNSMNTVAPAKLRTLGLRERKAHSAVDHDSIERDGTTIVHLISTGGFYGAERMLLDHVTDVDPGFRHRILFIDAPDDVVARFVGAGVPCARVRGWLRAALDLRRTLPGTVLNCHGYKSLAWVSTAFLVHRRPIVATLHGFTRASRKLRIYGRLCLALCRLPCVQTIVCVSESIAQDVRNASVADAKVRVVTNGLRTGASAPSAPSRRRSGAIGFIGRLRSEKGADLFLECFARIRSKDDHIRAVVIGDGPERRSLEDAAERAGLSSTIQFAGYVEDVSDWLDHLDVLVITSRTEGTPMAVLEAMRAGTPVASFAVGGVPDLLGHGRHGLLAPAGDPAALAARVLDLLHDDALADDVAASAYAHLVARYALRHSQARWRRIYAAASIAVTGR